MEFAEKYIKGPTPRPFTDYGFKKLFGEEPNKDLLLDFLNELLREEQGEIKEISYIKNEQLSSSELDRKAIFDLYCENERGEKFIVELQKAKRADWDYELKAVYTVAILDFFFDEGKQEPSKYRYDVKLTDIETCKVFYDKLTFIYLEMPKFNKSVDELNNRFEKWLYVLKNLNRLNSIPEKLREKVFNKLFEVAEIAKFTPSQVLSYEDSLKYYRDMKNSLDTAFDEGFDKGVEAGVEKVALTAISKGIDDLVIRQLTGLSEEQLEILKKKKKQNHYYPNFNAFIPRFQTQQTASQCH